MAWALGLRRQTALSSACSARSVVMRDCTSQPSTRLENRSIKTARYDQPACVLMDVMSVRLHVRTGTALRTSSRLDRHRGFGRKNAKFVLAAPRLHMPMSSCARVATLKLSSSRSLILIWNSELGPKLSRRWRRQIPLHLDRLFTFPTDKLRLSAIDKRIDLSIHLFTAPDE